VGRQGVIACHDEDNWGSIHLIQADGSSDPVMLSMHPSIDSKPSWSPDGSQIAFESLRDDPINQEYMDIYTMNADGSGLTRLTNTDTWYAQPDWSPDGSRIALVSDQQEPGNSDLYVLNLKTKELNRLTDDLRGREPSWSPDGSNPSPLPMALECLPVGWVRKTVHLTHLDPTGLVSGWGKDPLCFLPGRSTRSISWMQTYGDHHPGDDTSTQVVAGRNVLPTLTGRTMQKHLRDRFGRFLARTAA
jgi:tricorn protease-like protein